MGSSESKIAVASSIPEVVASTPKPKDPRHERLGQLVDPRSPSTAIDRTPIQVDGAVSRIPPVMVESDGAMPSSDPRSPSSNVARTPMKDSIQVSVSSFARRLGMLFLSEADAPVEEEEEEVVVDGDLGSSQPLLSLQPPQADLLPAPILSSPQSTGDDAAPLMDSPFVHMVEVEADLTLDEAEEAKESPLHKHLSMSLITYHDGTPSQFFAEVHVDGPQSPLLNADSVPHGDETDHSYAQLVSTPTVTGVTAVDMVTDTQEKAEMAASGDLEPEVAATGDLEPEVAATGDLEPEVAATGDLEPEVAATGDLEPEVAATGDLEPEVAATGDLEPEVAASGELEPEVAASGDLEPEVAATGDLEPEVAVASGDLEPELPIIVQELSVAPPTTTTTQAPPTGHSPSLSQQLQTGIRCPTFDTKSPSQVVFKPQWLGKGFGAPGLRARGRGGKASSPLSVRVGGKNVGNENKGRGSAKQKQRGKALMAEGRSPLQMLKATNSPIDQSTQMKLKVSTPDRQRLGQLDRRVLTVALNKENR